MYTDFGSHVARKYWDNAASAAIYPLLYIVSAYMRCMRAGVLANKQYQSILIVLTRHPPHADVQIYTFTQNCVWLCACAEREIERCANKKRFIRRYCRPRGPSVALHPSRRFMQLVALLLQLLPSPLMPSPPPSSHKQYARHKLYMCAHTHPCIIQL